MARPGPAPDPRSVNNNPHAEWYECPDVPFDYAAAGHTLPAYRDWHPEVRRWYGVVASLPHAKDWTAGDWIAVDELAILKQKIFQGVATGGEMTESRRREDNLGLTTEARQKIRVRYTPAAAAPAPDAPEAPTPEGEGLPAPTPISSARDRLRRRA